MYRQIAESTVILRKMFGLHEQNDKSYKHFELINVILKYR